MKCHSHTHAVVRPVIIDCSCNILPLPVHGSVIRRIVTSCSRLTTDTLASVQVMGKQISIYCQLLVGSGPEEMILHFHGKVLWLIPTPCRGTNGNQIPTKTRRHKGLSFGKPVIYLHVRFYMLSIHIATTGFGIFNPHIVVLGIIGRISAVYPARAVYRSAFPSLVNDSCSIFRRNTVNIARIRKRDRVNIAGKKSSCSLQLTHVHLFLMLFVQGFIQVTNLGKRIIKCCQFILIHPPQLWLCWECIHHFFRFLKFRFGNLRSFLCFFRFFYSCHFLTFQLYQRFFFGFFCGNSIIGRFRFF